MRLLIYSLMRLGVLVAVLALLWLVPLRGWLWLLVGLVVSAGISYLLLDGPRNRAVQEIASRPSRAVRPQADAVAEDAALDAAAGTPSDRQAHREGRTDPQFEQPRPGKDGHQRES